MFGLGKKKVSGPLAETRNWYSDRYEFVVIQRNLLFFVTIAALLGVAGAVYAVAELTASKTVEPYIIEVEDRTGITTLISQNSVENFTQQDAVIRYFVWKYIQARENYNVADYEYNYGQVVRLMSKGDVYRTFYLQISGTGEDSPSTLGRNLQKKVTAKSTSFLSPKKVQVRVMIETIGGQIPVVVHRIITLDFDFVPLELSMPDRLVNPLGFQVSGYSIAEDTQ
jgi:type IV secretion system protein VirB8